MVVKNLNKLFGKGTLTADDVKFILNEQTALQSLDQDQLQELFDEVLSLEIGTEEGYISEEFIGIVAEAYSPENEQLRQDIAVASSALVKETLGTGLGLFDWLWTLGADFLILAGDYISKTGFGVLVGELMSDLGAILSIAQDSWKRYAFHDISHEEYLEYLAMSAFGMIPYVGYWVDVGGGGEVIKIVYYQGNW